jgi:hypothetical protein
MRRGIALFVIVLLGLAPTLKAQHAGLATPCAQVPQGQGRDLCHAVAQAAESAQPQLGILVAGGNPVLGTVRGGGVRLGGLPRIDVVGRASAVLVRVPDILAEGGASTSHIDRQLSVPAPILAADAAVGIYPGFIAAPGIGGIGAVDVLASAAWLPFRAVGLKGFGAESPDAAWGVGLRVGVLREGFQVPGVAVTVMRRQLGRVAFGAVCPGAPRPAAVPSGTCPQPWDAGEFAFDLRNWSTRALVGKRLLGVGVTGGIGYDRYGSEVEYGFRSGAEVRRPPPMDLRSSRWSAFGNASYTFLLTSLALEAGWQQGGSAVPGFPPNAQFDPRRGTFFGSAALRVAF